VVSSTQREVQEIILQRRAEDIESINVGPQTYTLEVIVYKLKVFLSPSLPLLLPHSSTNSNLFYYVNLSNYF
jgi:hypothetical protein